MKWKPSAPGELPSLGWALLEWWADVLPSPRDHDAPLIFTDDQAQILVEWYRFDPVTLRFIHRRGASRRSKGIGKSPVAAAKAIAALAGDVRPDGFDAHGQPVGRPWGKKGDPNPWVQIAAVSEDQTDNTYSVLYELLTANDGRAADELGIDVGLTRCFLVRRPGKLEPVTASAGSREGQPITDAFMDEALALDTPLPTPEGWTTMGAVAPGQSLLGADGLPVTVLKVTDIQEDRDCYRVTFADGTSVIASGGHLWLARQARQSHPPKVRTTAQMAAAKATFRVPRARPAKLAEACLPIDGYLLGIWLGDGSKGQSYITAARDDADFYIEQIHALGEYARHREGSGHRTGMVALGCPRGPRPDPPSIRQRLRALGILNAKAVPAAYLRASFDQRLALLQGLMDTDGHVSKEGACTFVGANRALVDGVVELLRSLGQTAHVTWRADPRARTGGCHKVYFTPRGIVPFRLPRKVSRVRAHSQRQEWVTIRSIEPVPSVPVRCVAVDAADHLFLAGEGWNVTHNTHLWTPANGGVKLARTLRRNVAKMDGRSYETTNSFAPGEGSVAEDTHKAVLDGKPGIYYDAVEAPEVKPEDSDATLRAALRVAYGDAWWVDLDRLVQEVRDPDTPWEDAERFYFNHNVDDRQKAVETKKWLSLKRKFVVPAGAVVGLGFDGSLSDDTTALIGCVVLDSDQAAALSAAHPELPAVEPGMPFTFEIEVWSRPEKAPKSWRVPRKDIRDRVKETFDFYNVGLMLCDPAKWQTEIEFWVQEYGEERVVFFDTNQPTRMWRACDRFSVAVDEGAYAWDGSKTLGAHVLALHRRKVRIKDEDDDGRTKFVFVKGPNKDKIDAGIAAVLALEAAQTMPPPKPKVDGALFGMSAEEMDEYERLFGGGS